MEGSFLTGAAKMVCIGIPYPSGLCARALAAASTVRTLAGTDAGFGQQTAIAQQWLTEGGKGTKPQAPRFRPRPDPLAHCCGGGSTVDFVLDYVSLTTLWSMLSIAHALLAVALIGALTHQAVAVLAPVRQGGKTDFVRRFRSVSAPGYTAAVCLLWIVTLVLGGWIYTKYRIYVRIPIEQQGFFKTEGAFEMKEHLAAIGLGLLPIYWYLWKNAGESRYDSARKWLTVVLAAICWYAFLTGHLLNNVRGFGS
jgi:hypothetical protein